MAVHAAAAATAAKVRCSFRLQITDNYAYVCVLDGNIIINVL